MKHIVYLWSTSTSIPYKCFQENMLPFNNLTNSFHIVTFTVESGQILHVQEGAVLVELIISQSWLCVALLHIDLFLILGKISFCIY